MDTMKGRPKTERADLPTPLAERLRQMHASDDPRLNATLAMLKQLAWAPASIGRAMGVRGSSIVSRLASAAARDPLPAPDDPSHPLAGLTGLIVPPWTLTAGEVTRLRALTVAARNATSTPHGSEQRRRSAELGELMHRLSLRGVTPAHLARASGMPRHLVAQRLKRLASHDPTPTWGVNPAGTPENVRPTDLAHRTDPSTTSTRTANRKEQR